MVNITISGHPGSGTSTLVEGICRVKNWTSLNGGQIFRTEAKNRGLSLSEFGDLCKKDSSVDESLDEILKNSMKDPSGPEVMESRLSGWWAYKIGLDCARIWLNVNDEERARRVVAREEISYQQALENNRLRSQKDLDRYMTMYGLNPEDSEPYTHIIEASEIGADEVLVKALEILEEYQ